MCSKVAPDGALADGVLADGVLAGGSNFSTEV
jgi:hypothetical protein